MKLRNSVLIGTAVAMAAMLQTAQASVTLSSLLGGGTISIGDKTFSGFSWQASDGTLNSQAGNLQVSASIVGGIYYLDFGGVIGEYNGSTSPLVSDLKLSYTVTANPGVITMIDQNYTVNALQNSGQIIIGETVKNIGGIIVGNSTLTLNPLDLSDPLAEPGDNLMINPGESQLSVVKDISLVTFAGQFVGLSDVAQSFHQVPEATTVVAGALLLLPFGVSALRILRRNRVG